MKTFLLEQTQTFDRPLSEVFPFYAAAENLEQITPPWLRFRILSPTPIEMKAGALIEYRLRLHGIPVFWRSEITAWDPPHRFVDEQRRGPYRLWIHEHLFSEDGDGTKVTDRIRYAVLGGAWVRRIFVAGELEKIFDYRSRVLRERVFPSEQAPQLAVRSTRNGAPA